MPIKKALNDLPAADQANAGTPPDGSPRYGPALADAWMASLDLTTKEHAFDTRLRNSDAGKCTRAIQYGVLGVPKTDPPTAAGYWVMGLGTIVHERWQDAMVQAFPDAEVEVKVRYDDGFDSSGHIDLVLRGHHAVRPVDDARTGEWVTSMELKTINGWGFKNITGARGAADGPRNGHLLQCALNADAVDADEMVIVYLAMENISPLELKRLLGHEPQHEADFYRQFTAEWSYTREQYAPLAEAEKKRLSRVLEFTDDGQLVPRFTAEMPRGSRIVDPSKGMWQIVSDGQIMGAGTTWACDYCDWRKRCLQDGPSGPIPS